MNAGRAGLRGPDAVRCYAMGLFANLFLPSLVGGDVLRAGLIMGATRRRAAVILGSLADRGVDVAGLAFLLAIGGWLARDEISCGRRSPAGHGGPAGPWGADASLCATWSGSPPNWWG